MKLEPGPRIVKHLLLFFLTLMLVGLFVSSSRADEDRSPTWGFSLGVGTPSKFINYFWTYTFLPRVDLPIHRLWEFEIEGNLSYYDVRNSGNLYLLGLNTNFLFKPIRWNNGDIFLLGGGGLAYGNGGSEESTGIGNSHVVGTLQVGTGITYRIGKKWGVRGEYRFVHISDPFRTDYGLDTHQVMLGVTF